MKKIICILLAMLLIPSLALVEEVNPFAPYALTIPEGAELVENEGSWTVVAGVTRVVVMVIDRVPDDDPAEAIIRMMNQFEPQAVIGEDLPTVAGFTAVTALNADRFGEGVDQLNVMVLSSEGDLLILSGYDLDGDEEKVQLLLDAILSALTVNDAPIILTEDK